MAITNITGATQYSGITMGAGAVEAAKDLGEDSRFGDLVTSLSGKAKPTPALSTRLPGDAKSDFAGTYTSPHDRVASPQGVAAQGTTTSTIDRTSSLYEAAMELESYFVKTMLSSMRKTLGGTSLTGGDSNAKKIYEDMLYDEYSMTMTRNAGFGLSDQIYLSLKDSDTTL